MYLGIDFGTCYSSAALLLEGVPTPIPAPLTPGYALPSSVFITEQGEILVGQAAENKRQKNPQRYRREFKRDLGSPDPYTLGNVSMLPEELVAAVLKKLKEEAEKVALGRGEKFLTNALITVPATYSSYKRNLMQDAGRKAGFSQIEMLEEPVAAARYYSCHAQINDGDIILVYDLGGGTFDATLMQKQGDNYQVLAMPKGLANCGGTDFDRLIYQQLKLGCSDELRQQLEPKNAWLARAIVGDCCRDLKHQLSEQSEASIYIPMGLGNVETFELTREVFNAMIAPLIEETLDCCEQLVRSAKKDWTQVNQMLLVGGSSRIPYVKEAIERRFNISPFLVDKPELAVCLGAAINDSIPSSKPEPVSSPQEIVQKQIIQTHINLGDALYQQGELEEAIAKYQEAIRLEPYNVEASHRLQLAEQSLRDKQEAERRQRERESHEAEAVVSLQTIIDDYISTGDRFYQQGKLEEAIVQYKIAIELDANHTVALRKLEMAQQTLKERLKSDSAEHYFKKLIPYLQSQGFQCSQNVICGNYTLDCLALTKIGKVPYMLISCDFKVILALTYFDNITDINQLKVFSEYCIHYATQNDLNSVPIFGPHGSLLCPIIVVKEIDLYLIEKVTQYKPFSLGGGQKRLVLPGIYDLKNRQVIFTQSPAFLESGKFGIPIPTLGPGIYGIFDYWRKSISPMLIR
ncbi:MAG: tetratricopeptide repeat protein [Microcystis panniformis Mp_MB_F_20051200_S9]|uniref:Tetratricopeptide repeat protein n=1 Tax=Microcystis panniformis Mp_MB_F_20051200_S9 TaxID=2486223 RepID=A0A552PKS2_9CHRO|nr:MAG: tetratricopeptide repeat protein [Microcystis panniformis Mp_GB_SS_20050300_S99]TRV53229.1 MAG: tetratricopeptide repeat protein [Microcystis panniformis Mp_MB_F_20080800_S26D]TRV54601.1 MAG: tetratricopeptide repeat protein [Microcystis panniformis Mp_GB_SS_20050300_S99D]TRV57570.1 MAG: tetratricopeptide repeat protein [Microcystis panniformis Mp_MB_F_20051200_S9]TRV61286.1 MAG: tetratricopeptide repeat protein [Microcystis panniformis Mp_MB_F_20080800_S26]TRV67857.1 MAG: tetratricope